MIHATPQPIEDRLQPMLRIKVDQRRPHVIAHLEAGILRSVQHPVMVGLNLVQIIVIVFARARFPITIIDYRITITITNTGTFVII